jgi:hypothetical protein
MAIVELHSGAAAKEDIFAALGQELEHEVGLLATAAPCYGRGW